MTKRDVKDIIVGSALVGAPIAGYAVWGIKGAIVLGAPLVLSVLFLGGMYTMMRGTGLSG